MSFNWYIPFRNSLSGEMCQSLNELSVWKQTKSTALLATHQNSGAAACEGTSLLQLADCQTIHIFVWITFCQGIISLIRHSEDQVNSSVIQFAILNGLKNRQRYWWRRDISFMSIHSLLTFVLRISQLHQKYNLTQQSESWEPLLVPLVFPKMDRAASLS